MKLFLLKPNKDLSDDNSPWYTRWLKCHGFVIKAKTEKGARRVAHWNASNENDYKDELNPWLNPEYSSCVEIINEGKAEVILKDYREII